jgi:hypothetical protein
VCGTGKFLCGVLVRQPACAVDIPARCWQGIHSLRERRAGVPVSVMLAGAWDASENAQGGLHTVEGDEVARDWWCAWRLSEELRAMWMYLGAIRCLGSMAGLRCAAARLDACDGVEKCGPRADTSVAGQHLRDARRVRLDACDGVQSAAHMPIHWWRSECGGRWIYAGGRAQGGCMQDGWCVEVDAVLAYCTFSGTCER